ncbi:MAG: GFA family protein [Sphingomonadales bacterium]|nr:GFA family protein [Sphingomonadales bacterium]
MPHTGSCLCGQVRFTIETDPVFVGMCWCRKCQRINSGSPAVAALFPADSPHFTGQIAERRSIAESGREVTAAFCPTCGCPLYSRIAGDPHIRVRVGLLDNPDAYPPRAIIWASSAPSWAKLDPALPAFPGQPPERRPQSPEGTRA